ncbi:MAG: T9SS type A sorting domain-containing protein [Saprospiraceae bacterium]|nr:T9SS type A sorting domain-containing protein [Saprospiraceae bacterium]
MKSYFSRLMNVFNPTVYSPLAVVWCVLVALVSPVAAGAQQPTCFRISVDQWNNAMPGDTVCVPVTVSAVDDLLTTQFTLFHDTVSLQRIGVKTDLSAIASLKPSDYFLGSGLMRIAWSDPKLQGVDVPENGILFELCFVVKPGATPGLKPIFIDPANRPAIFEMVYGSSAYAFLPFVHQAGGVWVGASSNPTFDVLGCTGVDTCGKSSGWANLTMVGGTPPYSVIWEGPGGFVSNDVNIQDVPGGLYSATITDAFGLVREVTVQVPQYGNSIEVNVDITPSTCNQPTGCVRLSPKNGFSVYDYAWSTGQQGAQACNLTPGPVTVTVTSASGCFQVFAYTVPSESNFNAFLQNFDIDSCGGTGAARVVVNNGNGATYTYNWSNNGANTALALNLPAGPYSVTVSAGPLCSLALSGVIQTGFVADWNLQLLPSPCNGATGAGDLVLAYQPGAAALAFPLVVSWGDGTTRQVDAPPGAAFLDTLLQVPYGHYGVSVTTAEGCSHSVQSILYCAEDTPLPDSLPVFYVEDSYLNAQFAVDSCMGVYADHLYGITEVAFSLSVQSGTTLKTIRNVQLPGAFVWDSIGRVLTFDWVSPGGTPVFLPAGSLLFEVCTAPKSSQTYTTWRFTDKPLTPRLIDAQQNQLGFMGLQGTVLYGLYFPPEPAVCTGGIQVPDCATDNLSRVHLSPCHPDSVLNLYWVSHNGQTVAKEALLFADSGTYIVYANYAGWGASARHILVHIPGAGNAGDCVWPGDFDNNNAVNQYDLLYLGLAYGTQGAPRAGASLDWLGQSAADWPQNTGVRHVNFKNIDGNGDGVLNGLDTIAILQNWGRVIRPASDTPFDMPLSDTGYLNMPVITLHIDTLQPGQQAYLPVALGTPQAPVDSLYGLAFSISYDPDIIVPASVRFYPQASWFGDPDSNLIWIQRNYPALGRLDVAVTRTDGRAVSGSGIIGDMFIVIEDNIFFQSDDDWAEKGVSDPDSLKKSRLFFSGIGALVSGETPGSLNGAPVEVVVKRQASGVGGVAGVLPGVRLFPNPARDVVWVESAEQAMERVEVVDQRGALVMRQFLPNTQRASLSLASLSNGLYSVRVVTGAGIGVYKVVVWH